MLLQSDSYTRFLGEELARRMKSNPRYSQRAFAKQLGLSAGELSEVLRGKRRLSVRGTLRIAQALGLNAAETRHLAYLVQLEHSRKLTEEGDENASAVPEPPRWETMTLDMFEVVSEWYCFAVLNLMDCDDFRSTENWIARRLAISVAEARVALERLHRVGLIERKGERWLAVKNYVISPDGIPSEAIRNHHRQMLAKAAHALDLQPTHEREMAGVGFAVNPKLIPAFKKDVSVFLDEMAAKYGKGKGRTEVYQCEVALFRLTRGENHG